MFTATVKSGSGLVHHVEETPKAVFSVITNDTSLQR